MGSEAPPTALSSVTSIIRATVADGVVTFMWVFCASTLRATTVFLSSSLGLQHLQLVSLLITITLVSVLLTIFGAIGAAIGGASFNPTGTAAFYAAGLGADGLLSMAFRFPAQALGAVAGVLAISEVMPAKYKHMLGGPRLMVDLHTGAAAETLLTFLVSFAVMWIVVRGPRNPLLKTWMMACTIVTFVVIGAGYSGPAMNPALAFGWAYANKRHDTWEHYYIYWLCPFVGAILAANVFRFFFLSPAKKDKKQKKA